MENEKDKIEKENLENEDEYFDVIRNDCQIEAEAEIK